MDRTTVTCTDTSNTVGADILNKSDRRLEVALDGTTIKLVLTKKTPQDKLYVGSKNRLEFISSGK